MGFEIEVGKVIRVLIVEDNRLFREAFKEVLQKHLTSIVVEEARNGEEALQRIKGASPDVIFMDKSLGGMNGLEFAKQIKKDFPLIRIAMLTGYDFPDFRLKARRYGVDSYFVKDSLDWKEIKEFVQYAPEENRPRKGRLKSSS